MEKQVRVVNIRLPKELVDKIDLCIETDKLYTTRPDFMIESLRSLFTWIISTRIIDWEEEQAELVNRMRMYHMRSVVELLLDEFREYKGEPIQIVLRVPRGLFEIIDGYKNKMRPFPNFMTLLRASAVYGLHEVPDWKNKLNPEDYEEDPIFDFEQSGCDFASMFEGYDNMTELYRLCKKKKRT